MLYHSIMQADRPAWYRLGQTDDGALSVHIHPTCWEDISQRLRSDATHILNRDGKEVYAIPPFVPPDHGIWGHGCVAITHGATDGWREIIFPIPCIELNAIDRDLTLAFSTSQTLQQLFLALLDFERDATEGDPQLIIIGNMLVLYDTGGGSFSVTLSHAMAEKLGSVSVGEFRRVAAAMQKVHETIMPTYTVQYWDFRAGVDDNGLHLSCPGDACGLDPYDWSFRRKPNDGYEMVSHNVDSVGQQLTLLSGMAALEDIVRQKM